MSNRLIVLAILDGWGYAAPGPGNAISLANTPHMHEWLKSYPHSLLQASGTAVGLPDGVVGNSEVGHMNLGAGYPVLQDEVRINAAIADSSFFANQALVSACQRACKGSGNLHLLTIAGPGRVHSSIEHLWSMLELAKKEHVPNVFVHLFSDGRDASPTWLAKNGAALELKIAEYGAVVVSLTGRYYALDRDQRWDRTEKAYKALVERSGNRSTDIALAASNSYLQDKTDEFIEPTIIGNGKAIESGDEVVFLNFRTDRPRQLSQALVDHNFDHFSRSLASDSIRLTTMTEYEPSIPVAGVAFAPEVVAEPLAKVLSDAGLRQLHAAETEKYAHVTYFFNGGQEAAFLNEERLLVPSPKVATYDMQPAMSALELTQQVISKINGGDFDAVIINYANADMVGHTGNLEATIDAVATIDSCLGQLWAAIEHQSGMLLITADHGNAEVVSHPDHSMDTEHNSSPVPLIAVGQDLPGVLQDGVLSQVAPTILQVFEIQPPATMTATSLWKAS